jgi:DNA polymerase III subunit epsilon
VSIPLQLPLPISRAQPGTERIETLADQLCALLVRRARPLEVGHVVAQVLRVRGCPERLGRRLVAELVDGDARLAWHGRDLVGLAPPGWTTTPVSEASFVVVDLETTGGSPGMSKVTEIGAVRVRGLEVTERFCTLVDPGRPIPPAIIDLTGIDDVMVAGQPGIEEALERFSAFCGEDVLVAHNAPFDLRFLNYERRRLAGRYFTQPWLDTLVLAKRLLGRRVERHDLRTLAEWAGARTRPCHRALPDAEATAELLVTLLGLLADRGHDTLERAVTLGQGGGARYSHKLALVEDLPAVPGVYLMRDRGGAVLYVGKAANLRRRVRSYFGPGGRHGRQIGRVLAELDRVDHEVCRSELEALLRESELLRHLRPPGNRRGVGAAGVRYLKLTVGEAFPRLYAVARPSDDGALYFGPLRSERLVKLAVEGLHRILPLRACHALCADGRQGRLLHPDGAECAGPCRGGGVGDYAEVVDRARALLGGEPVEALGLLSELMVEAAAAGRLGEPEDRERVEALLGALAALARLRRATGRDVVLVEPTSGGESAQAFFVAAGRVVHRADLGPSGWRAPAAAGLARIRAARAAVQWPLPPEALDEVAILDERLRTRGPRPGSVPLPEGWQELGALAAVGRAVGLVIAEGPPPVEDDEGWEPRAAADAPDAGRAAPEAVGSAA